MENTTNLGFWVLEQGKAPKFINSELTNPQKELFLDKNGQQEITSMLSGLNVELHYVETKNKHDIASKLDVEITGIEDSTIYADIVLVKPLNIEWGLELTNTLFRIHNEILG